MCNICNKEINELAGDIHGFIGLIEFKMCVTCLNGLMELTEYEK